MKRVDIKDLIKELGDVKPYEGTHFPKGSAMEGLRIPTREDARSSAKNFLKAMKQGDTGII